MTQGNESRDPPARPQLRSGRRKSDTAFDLWLSRGLHQMFDEVAQEPIPDELLKLIHDDKQK